MIKDFDEWLASDEYTSNRLNTMHGQAFQIIRVPRTDAFDYLYCIGWFGNTESFLDKDYKYCGIYSRREGLLYDASYDLRELSLCNSIRNDEDGLRKRSRKRLLDRFITDVRSSVEKKIGNDRTKLTVTELQDGWQLSRLKDTLDYGAKTAARELYLKEEQVRMPEYRCSFSMDEWKEDMLLAYIDDPLSFVEKVSSDYIAEHQEKILHRFLVNDAVELELKALLADSSLPLHRIKKIIAAVKSVDAKTVNLTIKKDSTVFTFKYDASRLAQDCGNSYYTYHMAASDRRLFKKQFGEHADFRPEEIVCITYGRKVLYQSE